MIILILYNYVDSCARLLNVASILVLGFGQQRSIIFRLQNYFHCCCSVHCWVELDLFQGGGCTGSDLRYGTGTATPTASYQGTHDLTLYNVRTMHHKFKTCQHELGLI